MYRPCTALQGSVPGGGGKSPSSPMGRTSRPRRASGLGPPSAAAGGALKELIVSGNGDLPDTVEEAIAAWRTRQWVKAAQIR
eukprot:64636-Chlamydomonas_euryale.AAC.5